MNIVKQQSVKIIISTVVGLSIGSLLVWKLSPIASRCNVLYVAQDEIINLENERLAKLDPSQLQLFFGEIEKAVSLATSLPNSYKNKDTKVVYSMSAVSGDKVKSISKEIHQQIIAELSKGKPQLEKYIGNNELAGINTKGNVNQNANSNLNTNSIGIDTNNEQ